MTLDVWYWLFMAVWLFFGFYTNRAAFAAPGGGWVGPIGGIGVQFILFLIIGLRIFGSPIK